MSTRTGNPREAFIAGFHGGQIDLNMSSVELVSYIDGAFTREEADPR